MDPSARVAWHDSASWTGLLVERDQVRRLVDQAAHELADGRSSVLLVQAPPGGGLTTVLGLAELSVRARGARVVWARCSPDESALPFGAAAQVLTALGVEPTVSVPQLCRSVLDAAREQPLAVLVDDVQWIDAESAELLVALARRTSHAPLLLVVGNGLPGALTLLRDSAAAAGARVHECRPAPLGREGIARLLASACPVPADPAFVDAVASLTSGFPAAVRRVLLSLAQRSVPPSPDVIDEVTGIAAVAWHDLVERRVDAVPPRARRLASALAVCHGVFGVREAAVVAGLGDDHEAETEALTTAGLLVGDALPNDVVAELVLCVSVREEREELHAAAGELAHRTALPDEVVARFVLGAAPLGVPWVLEVLRNAATSARHRGDQREAVRLLERALREPVSTVDRAGLLVACGAAGTPHAPDAAERKLATVVAGGGAHRLAAAELILARGNIDLVRRLTGGTDAELGALYWLADEARHQYPELVPVPRPPSGEPRDTVAAATSAWAVVAEGRDIDRARRLARLAVGGPIARERLLLPWVLAARALALTGDLAESTAALDAIIIEGRRRCLPSVTGWALLVRAKAFARQGLLADAAHDLEHAVREVPLESWHAAVRPVFTALELVLALEAGRHDDAARLAAHEFPAGFNRVQFDFARGLLRLVGGDPDGASALFEECGRTMLARRWRNPALLAWRSFCAIAYRGSGRVEEAGALVREEIRLAELWGEPSALGSAHVGAAMAVARPESRDHRERGVAVLRGSKAPLRHAGALAELASSGPDGDVVDVRSLLARRRVVEPVAEPLESFVSPESVCAQAARAIW